MSAYRDDEKVISVYSCTKETTIYFNTYPEMRVFQFLIRQNHPKRVQLGYAELGANKVRYVRGGKITKSKPSVESSND